MPVNKLSFNYLTILFFMISVFAYAQSGSNCQQIESNYKIVIDSLNRDLGAIEIQINGSQKGIMKNLIGPSGFFLSDIKTNKITGLKSGTYSLVFVGRREEDKMCPKSFQVIIK